MQKFLLFLKDSLADFGLIFIASALFIGLWYVLFVIHPF